MNPLALVIGIGTLFVIAAFILVLNDRLRAKKAHAAFTKWDVIDAIQHGMSPEDDHDDQWGSFLLWPIRDPLLEAVRQRCIAIANQYSSKEKDKSMASGVETELRLIVDELMGLRPPVN